jgi:hypothetical protein
MDRLARVDSSHEEAQMWLPPTDQIYGQMFKGMVINPWDNPWTRMMQRFWAAYWQGVFAMSSVTLTPPAAPVARPTAEVRRLPERRS